MASLRTCDHCKDSIPAGTGVEVTETIFMREAKVGAHADAESLTFDLHENCVVDFLGELRGAFAARFQKAARAPSSSPELIENARPARTRKRR